MNDDGHRMPPIDLSNWLIGGIISLITLVVPLLCVSSERTQDFTKPKETIKINNK
jgi:hypothetical protein